MKNITIKSLKAENFKSFIDKEIVLNPQRTIIYGRNGIGKTTISDIVKWTLFGLADTSARPIDSNNEYLTINPIHTTVVFDVDGKEICIEKIQKMEFTRNGEFKGNKNSYLVNGIPKTAKALKEYVTENLLSMDDYLFFTDIDQFLKKSMDERREIVSKYATSVNDEDVIATDTRFSGISKMFKDGNLKELTLRCSRTIKELEKERDSIPARIDEISRQRLDIDVAEQELLKNSLVEQISNLDAGQADNEKKFEEYKKANDSYLAMKFQLDDMVRAERTGRDTKRRQLKSECDLLKTKIENIRSRAKDVAVRIEDIEKYIEDLEEKRIEQTELWSKIKNQKFDDSNLVCPYCKREYTEDKKMQIRGDFEAHIEEELKTCTDKGFEYKKLIDDMKNEVAECKSKIEEYELQIAEKLSRLAEVSDELESLNNSTSSIEETEEYKVLASEIKKAETLIENSRNLEVSRKKYLDERQKLSNQLNTVKKTINSAARNSEIDDRIAELKDRQKKIAQDIANEFKTKSLLEEFKMAKAELISASVNRSFTFVRFKLFETQVNGELKDTCRMLVNGVDMESGLNDSDSLLAGLDILTTFQRLNNVLVPVFLDRAESINESRIPDTDNQLILLKVSDDKELIVK